MQQDESIRELEILISLMDEPDEASFTQVRDQVIRYGKQALPLLEEIWLHTFNQEHNHRLEATIETIRFNELSAAMLNWVDDTGIPATELLHLVAEYMVDHYDRTEHQQWFQQIWRDCWLELNPSLTALETTRVINHVLYTVYGLSSFTPDDNHLEGFYPSYLQHNLKGNAMTMALIYLSVAEHLKLPIRGVDLSKQFVAAFMETKRLHPLPDMAEHRQNIRFYINPSNEGAIFTHKEITAYLKYHQLEDTDEQYMPCSRRAMAHTFLNQFLTILKAENRHRKSKGIADLLSILRESASIPG